jgi:hypothetical protein
VYVVSGAGELFAWDVQPVVTSVVEVEHPGRMPFCSRHPRAIHCTEASSGTGGLRPARVPGSADSTSTTLGVAALHGPLRPGPPSGN